MDDVTTKFTEHLVKTDYVRNFTWMGRPVLQYPMDMIILQELIHTIVPNFIIETGTADGGLTAFLSAVIKQDGIGGTIYSIDIKTKIMAMAMARICNNVALLKASSVSRKAKNLIRNLMLFREGGYRFLVILDSNHTHNHVLKELQLYAPLVSVGSYIVVFDTAIEFYGHLDKNQDRPWSKGNNPFTAVQEFMKGNDEFVVDKEIEQRALITAAPGGWLKRVK